MDLNDSWVFEEFKERSKEMRSKLIIPVKKDKK